MDDAINHRNSGYLSDLPVVDVDTNIRISPFPKAPAKVKVISVVGSDGQKCPIIFVADEMKIKTGEYQRLLQQHKLP